MRIHRLLPPLAIVVVLAGLAGLAGCGEQGAPEAQPAGPASGTPSVASPGEPTPSVAASPEQTPPEPTEPGRVVVVAGSEFGPMLFDGSGQAIYLFDKETSARPDCYGECAEAWPPVLTDGAPEARGDARSDLLGTTKRRDGSLQVTYDGHPLYYYAHEGKRQVLCHNVREYGGLWLVVTPDGAPAPA